VRTGNRLKYCAQYAFIINFKRKRLIMAGCGSGSKGGKGGMGGKGSKGGKGGKGK
jgi:hypothetical protein